jgi:mercuric reductase
VIGDPAFVYVAAYAGSLAAENALEGNSRTYDLSVVPRVTFTDPGVASVGLTEAEARARGIAVALAKLPMAHVPRALAARDTRGFIKLVADEKTGLLVGAHILAPEAGEMIQEAVMAIRFGIRTDEIASLLHPYLTNAEGLKLACQTFKKDVAKLSCCAALEKTTKRKGVERT